MTDDDYRAVRQRILAAIKRDQMIDRAIDATNAELVEGDFTEERKRELAQMFDDYGGGGWMSNERRPITRALKTCAEWSSYCLEIGWQKSQLDELEALWWKYHDD